MELNKAYLQKVFCAFFPEKRIEDFLVLDQGHINVSVKISSKSGTFLLQRINESVFRDIDSLCNTKFAIISDLKSAINYPVEYYQTTHRAKHFENWICCNFLEDSNTYTFCPNRNIAFSAGRGLATFSKALRDIEVSDYPEIIPDFHAINIRFSDLEKAFDTCKSNQLLSDALPLFEELKSLKPHWYALQTSIDEKKLKTQLVHNDSKLSNFLFDKSQRTLALIDLDTIMPGYLAYDFGDAVRSVTSLCPEDSTKWDQIGYSEDYFQGFVKGYFEELKNCLKPADLESLFPGILHMIAIMSIRFLTDYLNGSIYFSISHSTHNLDRAHNQLLLLKCFIRDRQKIQNHMYSLFQF